MLVHFNGWFVGGLPSKLDVNDLTSFRVGQGIIQSVSCICVNCFIVIAGYFGLNLKIKTFFNMFMILICVYIPCSLLECYINNSPLSTIIISILNNCFVFSRESWFIQCYLMLVFLSPVLNAFIERCGKNIIYYSFALLFIEFWFDCIRHNVSLGFNHGYSVIHFVVLYLLARTLKLHLDTIMKIQCIYWIMAFLLSSAIIFGLYVFGVKWSFWYSNIFVVISSFCLFMPFLHLTFSSKFINSISGSTFMVYLLHTTSPFYEWLRDFDVKLLNENSYEIYLLYILVTILGVFFCSVLYDKLRVILLGSISNKCFLKLSDRLNNKFFLYGK